MKMEQTECSETSAYKTQTPGNYPEENIQHTENGESLKSRIWYLFDTVYHSIIKTVYTRFHFHLKHSFGLDDTEIHSGQTINL